MVVVTISVLIGLIGLIIFVGYLASLFFDKTKIPDVLVLILMGLLLGPVFGMLDGELLKEFAPIIGTLALIIIVFEGSTKLNFFEVLDELPESIWYTTVVCVITAVLAMIVFVLGYGEPFNWVTGLLAGFVIAGTSYEIIVPLIAKLSIKEKPKTLLNLESALNDIITIVALVVLIKYITINQNVGLLDPIKDFAATFSIAIFLGIIAGVFWLKILQNYKGKQFEYLLTMAFVFFLYAIIEWAGGNGITGVLVFGLILGNSEALARMFRMQGDFGLDPAIKSFNAEISFFVRTMFLVYAGVLLNLGGLTTLIVLTSVMLFVAALAARYLATELLVASNPAHKESKFIITAMLPRGLATAVLASLPSTQGILLAPVVVNGITKDSIIDIVLLFMILTNIFATAASYYYETQIVRRPEAPEREKKK